MERKQLPEVQNATFDTKTVRILENLYAGIFGETNAILQYMNQSYILSNDDLYKTFEKIAIEEMLHHEALGKAIVAFGGYPRFFNGNCVQNNFVCIDQSKALNKMLAANIIAESNAISEYKKAIENVTNESLKVLLNAILLQEQEHLEIFSSLKNNKAT